MSPAEIEESRRKLGIENESNQNSSKQIKNDGTINISQEKNMDARSVWELIILILLMIILLVLYISFR